MMDSLNLKCFGVADGHSDGERNHSSYFYQFPQTSLLIDCGEGLTRSFKASGAGCGSFDHLIISHLHSDHFSSFFMFMQALWLEGRTRPLTVHIPGDAIDPVKRMLDAVYLFQEVLPFELTFRPHSSGEFVVVDELKITPFRTTHLDSFRKQLSRLHPGSYDAFCFLLETPGLRVGHSADLGSPEDLKPLLRNPLDLLVCELAHFSPDELFEYLQGKSIRELALIHLTKELWTERDALREQAQERLPGVRIVIPRDQMTLSLTTETKR